MKQFRNISNRAVLGDLFGVIDENRGFILRFNNFLHALKTELKRFYND